MFFKKKSVSVPVLKKAANFEVFISEESYPIKSAKVTIQLYDSNAVEYHLKSHHYLGAFNPFNLITGELAVYPYIDNCLYDYAHSSQTPPYLVEPTVAFHGDFFSFKDDFGNLRILKAKDISEICIFPFKDTGTSESHSIPRLRKIQK